MSEPASIRTATPDPTEMMVSRPEDARECDKKGGEGWNDVEKELLCVAERRLGGVAGEEINVVSKKLS